jgi:hypothetical protein
MMMEEDYGRLLHDYITKNPVFAGRILSKIASQYTEGE